ncbi:MAG: leucyl aminopeptidase [Nitriliruptoraceae bacterium]
MPITPTVSTARTPLEESSADTIMVGAYSTATNGDDPSAHRQPADLAADAAHIGGLLGIDLAAEALAAGFDGTLGAVTRIPTRGAIPAGTVTLVGLGNADELTPAKLSRAFAMAVKASTDITAIATGVPVSAGSIAVAVAARSVVEGLLLGAYQFDDYRSKPRPRKLAELVVHATGDDVAMMDEAVAQATPVAQAVSLARDLVNTPPQDKRPPRFADIAAAKVADLPIDVRILDEEALEAGGYGGILGVGQGSSAPPRLVELRYRPDGASRHVALVGKGITFDSGGLSLKPSAAMETMKCDMAGAAAVLATVVAAAQLGLPVEVTGLLALAENMPSGTATRVSDVLTMYGGKTVEVINTDAEGRLVLGDAIAHASELEPDVIVDLATLTGAQIVALGERISAMIANDDALSEALEAAGTQAGEVVWPLPLAKDIYGERINGNIADLKNVGNRAAGVIFGGLFLEKFVGSKIPWAHLDIAGPAWTDEVYGEYTKGGTGTPVRTLVAWLRAD